MAWQAMRVMRRFTPVDLMTTAEIGEDNIRKYLKGLSRAGVVRLVKKRQPGIPGSRDLWMLVRDTGPKPPLVRKDGVYDQNTRNVYPYPEVQS
jgi:hypothetical protein